MSRKSTDPDIRRAAEARRYARVKADPARYAAMRERKRRQYLNRTAAKQALRTECERLCDAALATERANNTPERIRARQAVAREARVFTKKYYCFGVWGDFDPLEKLKRMLKRAKQRAKGKGLPFALRTADVCLVDKCPVLGIKLDWFNAEIVSDKNHSPSLDRIDPFGGYVPGNVLLISTRANMLKNNGSLDEMQKIVKYLEVFG